MLNRKWMVIVAVMIMGLLVVWACGGTGGTDTGNGDGGGGESEEPIKIGVLGPHTGKWAVEGQGFLNAVRLLTEEVNAEGGVLGRQLQIVELDSKGEPQEATVAAQKGVTEGVVAVIGSYSSSITEPASQILNEANILHITPASTATRLTEKGYKQFFRTIFLDNRQGLFASEFITDDLGASTVAVIHDNSTYASGLADWTRKFLEERGADVVFYDAVTPGESDYKAVLTRVKAEDPEAVYFTGYHPEGGLIARQAKELGIEAHLVFGDANNNPDFIQIAGDAAEGVFVTTAPLPQDLPYDLAREFIDKYRDKYGEDPPSIYTLTAADAFRLIVHAIEETGSTDADTLAEFLHGIEDFPGITGAITYDDKGDREGSIHTAYIVESGKFVRYAGE